MAADPGLWLYIYPGGVTFTGTVVYTGGDSSKRYPDEIISSEHYTYNQVGGWSALYAGDFGTGEPIRITITVNGRDYIFDKTSVNTGSGINIFLDDLPMEDIPRVQITEGFDFPSEVDSITVKSLITDKNYTFETPDDKMLWFGELDYCDTVLVTAPGYKPLIHFVDPCPVLTATMIYSLERYTEGSIPKSLYGYENPNVTKVGNRWYGWTCDDSSANYFTVYTTDPDGTGGANMYVFDDTTNKMVYYTFSDSTSGIRDVGGQRYDRNPAYDIIIYEPEESPILYTANNSIRTGDILYNEVGYDTGLKIGTVNSDGGFKLDTVTITLNAPETRRASSGIIDGIAFAFGTDGVVKPSQIVVPKNKECTVLLVNGFGSDIYLDGELLANTGPTVETLTTSFTPTKDCTLEFIVYSGGGGYPGQD
jgi:hypothetical protein